MWIIWLKISLVTYRLYLQMFLVLRKQINLQRKMD